MPYHSLFAATCAACHGSKRVGRATCTACDGTGVFLLPLRPAAGVLVLCGVALAVLDWLTP